MSMMTYRSPDLAFVQELFFERTKYIREAQPRAALRYMGAVVAMVNRQSTRNERLRRKL